MTSYLFHKLAREELLDARDYYDELVYGLGHSFVNEIDKCLNIIRENPLAYPIIKENIRRAVVIKFPYSILYRTENDIIYILAVMHQKRKPEYWSGRI